MEKVQATGVNRILQWMAMYDCGTISAERTYDDSLFVAHGLLGADALNSDDKLSYRIPNKVNHANSISLRALLKKHRYSYILVHGMYKEAGGKMRSEESYFVFDRERRGRLKQDLIDLGFFFDQDTITYADAGSDFSLYETTPFLDYGGLRSAPTGKRVAGFHGFSVKRILQKVTIQDRADLDRRNLLLNKPKLNEEESQELARLVNKYASQFFSEEEVLTRVRGKGISWSNYRAINASTERHFDASEFSPTELLAFKNRCDRIVKYSLSNSHLLGA